MARYARTGRSAGSGQRIVRAPDAARRIEAFIARLLVEIRTKRRRTMDVHPDYRGNSIVPVSITYIIDPGHEQVTIPIW